MKNRKVLRAKQRRNPKKSLKKTPAINSLFKCCRKEPSFESKVIQEVFACIYNHGAICDRLTDDILKVAVHVA